MVKKCGFGWSGGARLQHNVSASGASDSLLEHANGLFILH